MAKYVERSGLEVAPILAALVEDELLPGLPIEAAAFWNGCCAILRELAPANRHLLEVRADFQRKIDDWLAGRRGQDWDNAAWIGVLRDIGYIVPEGPVFEVETGAADPEIASVAGPQLVVPVMNARFALNAANARWGSLYDALYGTNAIPGAPEGKGYDARRGAEVVAKAAAFLDDALPLISGSHRDVTQWCVADGKAVAIVGGKETGPADPSAFVGQGGQGEKRSLLFRHNGLHIELVFDSGNPVGAASASGLCDVVLEAALTAIQDCEDSIAAVDAADKVVAYRIWLGLMRGDIAETFEKAGRRLTRRLNPDRVFTAPDGSDFVLPGRSVMLMRNVGHLMTTDAVLLGGEETPEGLLDAIITVTAGLHDLRKADGVRNSRAGSIYIVKPKIHGPDEAAFVDRTYAAVEDLLGLAKGTVKLGLMDEERRTSANLRECIRALKGRIAFINTGFLDRTGDEIHTMMQAGPVLPKGEMKNADWLAAYEHGNVDAGLAVKLNGKGQIGKGMWAMPDAMAEMLAAKGGQPEAGASTAWVPSPTAASLHAIHYHQVKVAARQRELAGRERADIVKLMTPPLLGKQRLSEEQTAREIDRNCQSILGYVVRWVDLGIGCSKVPDIDNVPLMEDRATLRISAQFLCNWMLHGLITAEQVEDSLRRMAVAVDAQNAGDPAYRPMAPGFGGAAFRAARDLIFEGREQPSGYTEPLLHAWRRVAKEI